MRKFNLLSEGSLLHMPTFKWVFYVLSLLLVLPQILFGSPGTKYTTDNSGLLSNKTNTIFVDSFNIKWFGTDKGISRFDSTNLKWDTINTNTNISGDTYLLNNNIKQIAYERTSYGHEMWVATDSGLSVIAFDIDGVTSATTYVTGESGILNDTITAVGVDAKHNRWIGTPMGISVFAGDKWDTLLTYLDWDDKEQKLSDVVITGVGSYEKDSMAYITTQGTGIIRYSYDEIDGFTGASTMEKNWARFLTDNFNSVTIYDTIQYYGTDNGLRIHYGKECKINWLMYFVEDGLASNNVRAVEVDDSGAIWIGTDKGLNVKYGKKWYTYNSSDGIVNEVINDIKIDTGGVVWIATDGGIEYFTQVPGRQTGGFFPIQARNIVASNVESGSSDISWIIGDEEKRVAFIKEGKDGLVAPVNGTNYAANTVYGQGDEAKGWYCIYNGTGDMVTITGLSPHVMYRVMVCEYSGLPGAEKYVDTTSTGNPANFTTLSSGIEEIISDKFIFFPNPFRSFLEINNINEQGVYQVSIYNLEGKLQGQLNLSGNKARVDTEKLTPGTYIIQISKGENIYCYKVVKQ